MEDVIGSIQIYAFSAIPDGWAACAGQIVPIQKMQSLYALIGNVYGGDGHTTFALPDLRGRVPVGAFQNSKPLDPGLSVRKLGEVGGEATHELNGQEMPKHNHTLNVSTVLADLHIPTSDSLIAAPSAMAGRSLAGTFGFTDTPGDAVMNFASLGKVGGNPHNNMQPYVGLNYCICFVGNYPQRQ